MESFEGMLRFKEASAELLIKANLQTDTEGHFNAANQIWIKFDNLMPFPATSGIGPGNVQCWNFSVERKDWKGVE